MTLAVRSADRVAGAALLALAVGFSAAAWKNHAYWGENGPGSGFLPFWLGLVMAALAAMLLVGALRAGDAGAAWLPRGESLRRLATVLGATTAYVALLDVLGMTTTTVLFMLVLLRLLDRQPWRTTVIVALAIAGFNHLVFARWLHVPLPVGPLGF